MVICIRIGLGKVLCYIGQAKNNNENVVLTSMTPMKGLSEPLSKNFILDLINTTVNAL